MKLFIASDIHGSAFWCEKMLEAFEREGTDRILLLGDILYHGPRNDLPDGYAPKRVIEMLAPYKDKILCVRGNCEAEVDQMVLNFPCLADYAALWTDNVYIFATHGHVYNENNVPPMPKNSVLLHGHTHVPKCKVHDGYVYINPGSVSIPKEDSKHGYVILADGVFSWKSMDGKQWQSFDTAEIFK